MFTDYQKHTGARLNFGLASEREIGLGFKVNMVIVDDDIALPDLAQPRGIAGTLLVHKIAAAVAEKDASLTDVTDAAQKIVDVTKSIGMSIDTCTIPGSSRIDRIEASKAELG